MDTSLLRTPLLLLGESLEGAILACVAYFDVFGCAPRAAEIHRFSIARRATRAEVEGALFNSPELASRLGSRDGFWYLAGKDHLALRRRRFIRHSDALWPEARRIARIVEKSGLASCGLVTGSLAAENADEHADIDFLFTYPADRTWTSYAGVRLLAKAPPLGRMCANYVLSEAALEIRPQNLFTAWELAKAVPMFGFDVYRRMVLANRWVTRFLPNAMPLLDQNPEDQRPAEPTSLVSRALSGLTRTRAFRALEEAERKRKAARDRRDVGVDMAERAKSGSMDRHSPTRSFFVLSELRYRMTMLGLEAHPLFRELAESTLPLANEMTRWGPDPIVPANGATNGASAKKNGATPSRSDSRHRAP